MALYIKANGEARKVTPEGSSFTIAEIQKYVGGKFEPHLLGAGGHTMFVNEFGHFFGLPYNDMATACSSWLVEGDYVAGDALLVNNFEIKNIK